MATTILKSKIESIGAGKGKAEFLEVLFGADDVAGNDVDTAASGVFLHTDFETGSTLDNPFGLVLVSQSVSLKPDVSVGGSRGGALAFVVDQTDGIQDRIMDLGTFGVDHIVQVGNNVNTFSGSNYPRQNLYSREDYTQNAMQRIFVGKTIGLELQHFIDSNAADVFIITAKYVFKKVKMTKSAYIEKLAMRAYD
jgi:hypothetical protein